MPFYAFLDPTYILVIIGVILTMAASAKVRSTFNKYSSVRSMSGETGLSTAQQLLYSKGIHDVRVEHVQGELTDHFDPRNKVLRLSDTVYASNSVAAIGVAAHECGHAVQHNEGYVPLKIRATLVPIVNFGSNLSWPMILIGVLFGYNEVLINVGIFLFSFGVLFQLVTLPVEFNASKNAMSMIENQNILRGDELKDAKKVLQAASLTYVAGAAASILQLLRLLILFGGRGRRND